MRYVAHRTTTCELSEHEEWMGFAPRCWLTGAALCKLESGCVFYSIIVRLDTTEKPQKFLWGNSG